MLLNLNAHTIEMVSRLPCKIEHIIQTRNVIYDQFMTSGSPNEEARQESAKITIISPHQTGRSQLRRELTLIQCIESQFLFFQIYIYINK